MTLFAIWVAKGGEWRTIFIEKIGWMPVTFVQRSDAEEYLNGIRHGDAKGMKIIAFKQAGE